MDPGNAFFEAGHCTCNVISQYGKPLERRKVRHQKRCKAQSLVGTPNYIAPEVLMTELDKTKEYSQVDTYFLIIRERITFNVFVKY